MEFVVFFFLTWLVISIQFVINKKIHLVESTFVFLIILIVSINFSWIIIDELFLIKVSKKMLPYLAYLLNRSIIIPILILIHLNLIIISKSPIMKYILWFSSVWIFIVISFLASNLDIIEFRKWTYWYEAIYYFCLNIIAFLAYKFIHNISRNVVRHQ